MEFLNNSMKNNTAKILNQIKINSFIILAGLRRSV